QYPAVAADGAASTVSQGLKLLRAAPLLNSGVRRREVPQGDVGSGHFRRRIRKDVRNRRRWQKMTSPTPNAVPTSAPGARGLSFRANRVLGVCGLVLLTGAAVLWLAHRSAKASTEMLTASVFREVSGRAATHTRGFVLRAAPVVESL